jgi:UDP:flavonoid glycosyltransferase YjiC (YdhE family)
VLFIPCVTGVRSHLVALLALAAKLDAARHESAFLLPANLHNPVRTIGNVLDIDYAIPTALRDEIAAIERFRADIVVDDLSLTAIMSTQLARKPRVAIQRTGVFPGAVPRRREHRHSCPVVFDALYLAYETLCGAPKPTTMSDICAADMKIVPGIPTVEVLPDPLVGDPTYAFAGSLIVDDRVYAERDLRGRGLGVDAVQRFLDANADRPVVYVTMGHIYEAASVIHEAIRYLTSTGACVVSNVQVTDLPASERSAFFFAPVLPMHTVCSRARLMIHHCGSGTYQYSIIHALPALCIGSGCYDRDDVALRLHDLGAAHYIASPQECPDFLEQVKGAFARCMGSDDGAWYASAKATLRTLQEENARAMETFDFNDVLERGLASYTPREPASAVTRSG